MHKGITKLSLVASAALIAALTGCASDADPVAEGFGDCEVTGEAGSITLDTKTEGVLTVGTTLPSPAWWQGTSPENIDGGFEYCIAAEIAHRAGLDGVVVNNISWDGLIAGQNDDFDIALAQVSITPEREEAVTFSVPYYTSMVGILVDAEADVTPDNIADKKLGYQVGTTAEAAVDIVDPAEAASTYQEVEALVAAVQAGQIDAALQDSAIMVGFAQNSGGALEVVGQFDTDEHYGAIIPDGSPNESAFNEVLTTFEDDGTLNRLNDEWLAPAFGGNPLDIPMFN